MAALSSRSVVGIALGLAILGIVLAAILKGRQTRPVGPPAATSVASAASTPSAPAAGGAAGAANAAAAASAPPLRPPLLDETPDTLEAQREVMFQNLRTQLGVGEAELEKLRSIVARSRWLGQGNPKITKHPMTRAECQAIRSSQSFRAGDARCGAPNMVPLFDPSSGETAEGAKLCIDQYEFPNIACDYPVTWVRSNEAEQICQALGKRLCDAHEWEGGCAGALRSPETEYSFGERRLMQEYLHNKDRELIWAYGKQKNHALCATGSAKSPKCYVPSWEQCGTNTYPAGAFPACVSALGVYDQHGNAAEHMNLPLTPEELGSRGGSGETEMKGSWFMFGQGEPHEDDCRWRALAWHAGKLMAEDSHHNYHLGFRCCKDLAAAAPK